MSDLRVWGAPPEPGPDVTRVVGKYGVTWSRIPGQSGWWHGDLGHPWEELFWLEGPLREAKP